MKVLEVSSLETGIDNAVRDIDTFYDQISAMQRAVRDFYGLEDALKGKGGDAIRSFFNEVHQPFLIYLYQSMVDYQNVLTDMKDSVKTFESHSSGFVSQQFLEQDVEDGFYKVKKKTISLTDDANSIIESVQDLVAVKNIDDSEVLNNVQDGKKKAERIVEELTILDDYGTSQLEQTKEDLQTMKTYLSDIESRFKSGDLSVANFDLEAVKGIDSYRSMMDSIYGEGYIDSMEFKPLFEKMLKGETLTPAEKGKLYDYFQHVYLDTKTKDEIKAIADSVSEDGIDKLKERLNEKVVISKDALEDEMAIVQAYLYLGDKIPSETHLDNETRAKLGAYLVLLKNYHSAMEGDTVIIVDKLKYEKNHEDVPGHYIFSALQTADYNVDKDIMDKERFREWIFDPDNFTVDNFSLSEITYYTGTNAAANHISQQMYDLEDKLANYTPNFVAKKVYDKVISQAANALKIGEVVNIAKTAAEYQSGKDKLEREIKVGDAQKAAIKLDLEYTISKNRSIPSSGEQLDIQLYPKDKTFEILDRWQEVHRINPEIPYPEDPIQSQDWYETSEILREVELEYGMDLTDYIVDGTLSEDETVNDITNGTK